MFSGKYPVSKMAFETGRLEEAAKTGEKNQISLWLQEKVYNWDEFKKNILEEKLLVLQQGFSQTDEHGKAFIYKMLALLRNNEAINIARLAYLLARSNMNEDFTSKIFNWAQNDKDKNQLITALEYYIYQIREAN